jgi:hypothetical protein
MRITKEIIRKRIAYTEERYLEVLGVAIDPGNGYAQCSKHSTVRPNEYTCSPAENAQRIYGEYSALVELLD